MILYHYKPLENSVDEDRLKYLFDSLSLFCTNPNSFNDPFDSSIGYVPDESDNDSWKQICKFLDSCFQHNSHLSDMSYEQFNIKQISAIVEGMVKSVSSHRMVCFSEDWNNILMWSHYASYHRGIVIGLDMDIWMSKCGDGHRPVLKEIKYKDGLPSQKEVAFKSKQYKKIDELIVDLFWTRKARLWSYENEWRIIVPTYGCAVDNEGDMQSSNSNPLTKQPIGDYVWFPKDTLVEIVLGLNTDIDKEEKIKNWIQEYGLKVRMFKAKKCIDRYGIDRDLVTIDGL